MVYLLFEGTIILKQIVVKIVSMDVIVSGQAIIERSAVCRLRFRVLHLKCILIAYFMCNVTLSEAEVVLVKRKRNKNPYLVASSSITNCLWFMCTVRVKKQ